MILNGDSMLFKKMLRDMKKHKMQFISIFLMAFITLLVFVGVGAEVQGLDNSVHDFYNQTNMADIWLYGDNFSNKTLDDISNISSTNGVERQLVLKTTGDLDKDPTVTLHFIEKNELSQYYPIKGGNIDFDDKKGIWLDQRFAETKNLDIGDNITVKFNGMTIEKTIRGLGYSPEYVYEESDNGLISDFSLQGFGYLSYKAFPLDTIQYNKLLIKTNDSTETYHEKLDNAVDNDTYNTFMPRSDLVSDKQVMDEIDQHTIFAVMFPVIFVVVALLTLLTTMTRIVNHQRTQIGTLKSLGFTNRSLMIHYFSYGFYLTLVGSILGMILGYYIIPPFFFPSMSTFYTLPSWESGFNIKFIIVGASLVLVSLAFTYIATKNIIRESPASALEPKAPKISKIRILENTRIWDKLNFSIRWNIRDVNRNKMRSLVTILGVLGCTVLLISAFGMQDGMDDLKSWQYEGINHYETQLVLEDNITSSQIDSIQKEVNGTQLMMGAIEVEANGVKKTQTLSVYNKTDLITPTNQYMEKIDLPENGITITQKTSELLNVGIGDTIKWHLYGNSTWHTSKIDAINADPATQGIIMTPQKLDDFDIDFKPTYIITNQSVDKNLTGVASANSINDLVKSWDDLTKTADLMVGALLIFAIVLSIVVLYSLGILGFTEVERDMATLKVLGFKTKNLQKLFLTQNLALSIVGYVLGVPTGYAVLDFMWDTVGDTFFYPTHYTARTIILSFILTIVLSLIVNYLLTRKLKKIDMVQSLKKERE